MKRIRGPLSFGTNDEVGCLVEGFDTPPMILMPHHRDYQDGLIERAGFVKLKDLYAWRSGTCRSVHARPTKTSKRCPKSARGTAK